MASDRILPPSFSPLSVEEPQEIGGFRLLGQLGTGGMGTAFLAERDNQWVVVKVLKENLAANIDFRTRLRRELDSLRQIPASDSIRILADDLECASPWFAMEYVEGQTLADRVRTVGPLHGQTLTNFAKDLGQSIGTIHQAGITHRDIKPSNIVLSPTGPRIIDFGVAVVDERTAMTTTGVMVGTLGWAAPEQVAGDPVGQEADVHAWGLCVLYAATGKEPFAADSPASMLYKVVHTQPQIPTGLPGELTSQISAALRKIPSTRPSMAEISQGKSELSTQVDSSGAIEPTQMTEGTQAIPPSVAKETSGGRGRKKWMGLAIGIVAMVGLIGVGLALLQPSSDLASEPDMSSTSTSTFPTPTPSVDTPDRPSETPVQTSPAPEPVQPPRVTIQPKSGESDLYEITWQSVSVEDSDPARERQIKSLLATFTDEAGQGYLEVAPSDALPPPEFKGFYDATIEQINCNQPYLCFVQRGSVLPPGGASSFMFIETLVVDYETASKITIEDFVAPNQLGTLVTLTERAILATDEFNQTGPLRLSATFEQFANVIPFEDGLLVYFSEQFVGPTPSEVFVPWDLDRERPTVVEPSRASLAEIQAYICPTSPQYLPPLVDEGADPTATRILQSALIEWFGQDPGPVDGSYGSRTIATVKLVQEILGVVPDGQVGPITWGAIQGWFCFAS